MNRPTLVLSVNYAGTDCTGQHNKRDENNCESMYFFEIGDNGMSYPPEVKKRVCQMYREGTLPKRIAEKEGIPLNTIYRWTRFVLPPRRPPITCQVCGKEAEKTHPSREYCSPKCRRRAKHRRFLDKEKKKPVFVKCEEESCQEQFPERSNKQFCSPKCKNKVAKRRQRNIETLEKVIKDAPDNKINQGDYESEISTIKHFLTGRSLPKRQRERVQNILKQVVA